MYIYLIKNSFRGHDKTVKKGFIYLFQEIILNKSLRKFLELKEWI